MGTIGEVRRVVSVSGGKDSQACAILAADAGNAEMVFCDTGNEHPDVLDFVSTLPEITGLPLSVLKADFSAEISRKRMFIARDSRFGRNKKTGRKIRWTNKAKRRALAVLYPTGNSYLDLCLWKGRFPSRRAQFCTQELKRRMLDRFLSDRLAEGFFVESWRGERRDESARRRDYAEREEVAEGWTVVRPVVTWTAKQVIDFIISRGKPLNPMYSRGFNRVGCAPCINSSKDDLLNWVRRYPDVIDRLREWEVLVGQAAKRGGSTFFHVDAPEGVKWTTEQAFAACNIDVVVEWAKTSRGGKQYDLLRHADMGEGGCSSNYGLCE